MSNIASGYKFYCRLIQECDRKKAAMTQVINKRHAIIWHNN